MGWLEDLMRSEETPIAPTTPGPGQPQQSWSPPPGGATVPPQFQRMGGPDGPTAAQMGPPAVPAQPEVPPITEASDESNTGLTAENALQRALMGDLAPPRGPTGVVMGPGEDYSHLQGAEGKDVFTDAFVDRPAQLERAVQAEAGVEEQAGKATADFYRRAQEQQANENAVMQQRRVERNQQIAAQQAQLEQATKRYSDDLADTGKFWRNPGNVLSAFAASLMTLGSSRDPMIGQKIINQAIQQDFAQRKALADMHLGELRSNLGNYRQIAGDQEMGDKLALSESYRIAAMELQRIGGQFQGPLAKARADRMAAQLMQASALKRMEVYKSSVFQPAQITDPRIAKAVQGAGMYSPFAQQANPGQPTTSAPANGSALSTPKANGSAQVSSATVKALGSVNSQSKMAIAKDLVNQRAPGAGDMLPEINNLLTEEALRSGDAKVWADPHELGKAKMALYMGYRKQADEIQKTAVEKGTYNNMAWREFQSDIQRIKAGAQVAGMKPDDFLGSLRTGSPEWDAKYKTLMSQYGSEDTPAAKQKMEQLRAADRFRQNFASKRVDYFHDKFGGAMSETEIAMGNQVINGSSSWSQIESFGDAQSKKAAAQWNDILRAVPPAAAIILRTRQGISNPGRMDSQGYKPKGK